MTSSSNYGIFLEPNGSLLEAIESRKRMVRSQLKDQAYLSHPPHCTLYYGTLSSIDEWQIALTTEMGGHCGFNTHTVENFAFYDDPLADYGHTIAIRIESHPCLFTLQLAVAKALQPHIRRDLSPPTSSLVEQSPFRESFEEYNFPFVGEHWIPHFTISSLAIERNSPLISELLDASPHFEIPVHQLSIWQINGDHHDKLATLPLA